MKFRASRILPIRRLIAKRLNFRSVARAVWPMTHTKLDDPSRGVALDQEKTRLCDQHVKRPGVSHDVSPCPQLNTTMTRFVGSCGEHPKAATRRTCNLSSASRLLNTHGGNHRVMELVSEIDAPTGHGRRTSSRSSTALGGKQRADIGGPEGKLHHLETLSARPKGPQRIDLVLDSLPKDMIGQRKERYLWLWRNRRWAGNERSGPLRYHPPPAASIR